MDKVKMNQWQIMAVGNIAAVAFAVTSYMFELANFTYTFYAVAISLIALVIIGLAEMGWKYVFAIVAFGLTLFLVEPMTTEKGNLAKTEQAERNEKAAQDWITASCPVYKGECGSKAKYACEIKVATVGRIDLGDSFVQSYPSCAK